MVTQSVTFEQPLGRFFTLLGRDFLSLLNDRLKHLELERHYYSMILIDASDGGITQQELAELLDIDKVLIVRIINHLTEKGYVVRARHAVDKRKYCLQLTNKAKSEINNIKNAMMEVNSIAYDGFTQSQIDEFQSMLKQIRQNLKTEKKNIANGL